MLTLSLSPVTPEPTLDGYLSLREAYIERQKNNMANTEAIRSAGKRIILKMPSAQSGHMRYSAPLARGGDGECANAPLGTAEART
jgi:hypothetical protein